MTETHNLSKMNQKTPLKIVNIAQNPESRQTVGIECNIFSCQT